MKTIGVIPARWGSSRFPGKSLALISGKPMIQRVIERVENAEKLDTIVLATDDKRIANFASDLNKSNLIIKMTSSKHATGTDRIAEAVADINANIIINIQGDEPLIEPKLIDHLIDVLKDPKWDIVTAATLINKAEDIDNPSIVKVVFNDEGKAMYFSRSRIPYNSNKIRNSDNQLYWRHIGIYGYQKESLLKVVSSPQSRYEIYENLEQLRALSIGCDMYVCETKDYGMGIDNPEDIFKIEKIIKD